MRKPPRNNVCFAYWDLCSAETIFCPVLRLFVQTTSPADVGRTTNQPQTAAVAVHGVSDERELGGRKALASLLCIRCCSNT